MVADFMPFFNDAFCRYGVFVYTAPDTKKVALTLCCFSTSNTASV